MMNSMMFDRRRAERFAQLLEEADGAPHRHGENRLDEELAGYVRLGEVLRPELIEGTDSDFRADLRAMLVAAAERHHQERASADGTAPAPPTGRLAVLRPQFSGRRVRVAAVVGLVLGTVTLSGMSAASGSAMPGDALYSVKRSAESARLALAGSDVSRGELYLQFARNRVGEAAGMRNDRTGRSGVLADMDSETVDGVRLLTIATANRHDATALDAVDAFVRAQYPAVSGLGTDERVRGSLSLLERISERSHALRRALACGAIGTPGDTLGAVPTACDRSDETTQRRPTSTVGSPTHHPESSPTTAGSPSSGAPTGGNVTSPALPSPSISPAPSGGLLGGLGKLLGGL